MPFQDQLLQTRWLLKCGCEIATLVERLERIGVNVKIKWPNDLLVDGKKLAGILPRLFSRGGELRLFRVGVGLNVFNNVPKEGISLKQIFGDEKMNINVYLWLIKGFYEIVQGDMKRAEDHFRHVYDRAVMNQKDPKKHKRNQKRK